ncbi:Uncharacterised protein [Nocardiopsis dassonvillei]|uniref:Atonal protein 8 n=1 Tax=Nocardiopsis dassonvillei (strain ATCC 23218 / DSM 43111 / CIP 107115 / JCM 7437 / KCTC 9190 / NBRC 14626 / NCTC 10488 / NRRL B-5397 / IMRU 509) TaxID=446468 RepID=D7B899_NOCDD|nr:atonal protein 8 [Nocardiopsis dassonvillei subsp. dassonvillei DSM 43111]VEI91316.1 Uncharacterised protein [Nocardiopsis dassonvillei]
MFLGLSARPVPVHAFLPVLDTVAPVHKGPDAFLPAVAGAREGSRFPLSQPRSGCFHLGVSGPSAPAPCFPRCPLADSFALALLRVST